MRPALLLVTLIALGVVVRVTPLQTPLDGVWHLAERLLHGAVGFNERTDWCEMYARDGKFYLPYSPLSAVPLMPLVALFGTERIGQPVANALFLVLSAWLLRQILARRRRTRPFADLAALVYLLATPMLASLCQGTVWVLLHSEGNLFLLAALYFRQRHRWAWMGFFVALALGCRNGLIPALPGLFLLMGFRRKRVLPALAGAALPAALALFLNARASGGLFVSTYNLAYAEWNQLPAYALENLPINAPVYFLSHPALTSKFPFVEFSADGNALWSVSPIFLLLVLVRPWKNRETLALTTAALGAFVPYLFFRWHGERQLGTRYTTDLFPFLFLLLAPAVARHKNRLVPAIALTLLILSLYLNLSAALLIRLQRIEF
jgi:hypothetical protein